MFQLAWKVSLGAPFGTVSTRPRVCEIRSPDPLHHSYDPLGGCGSWVTTSLSGRGTITACVREVLYSCGPSSTTRSRRPNGTSS